MRKVNIEELTTKFNTCRMNNQGKSYTNQEVYDLLFGMGFNKSIISKMISKGYLSFEKLGNTRLYSFQSTPLHKNQIEGLYNIFRNRAKHYHEMAVERNSVIIEESAAIEALQKKGYMIRKPVGFDLEALQREMPHIYKKYIKYEYV